MRQGGSVFTVKEEIRGTRKMVSISKSGWKGHAGEERCESGVGFVLGIHNYEESF